MIIFYLGQKMYLIVTGVKILCVKMKQNRAI